MSLERGTDPELSYFELQIHLGTTKHMGGFESTKELIALCHVDRGAHVLDVGCGVGATATCLVKQYGCKVVGVDVREGMVARSKERARREGVADRVEFRVADARDLSFDDALFDALICESVLTFIEDKQRAVSECARVTRPGGYVGLNEEILFKTPPPAELVEYARLTWGIETEIPVADDWVKLLQSAGLRDIVAKPYKLDFKQESTRLRRYGPKEVAGMLFRTFSLYVRSRAFRQYMAERRHIPADLFGYLGYGLFVGRR